MKMTAPALGMKGMKRNLVLAALAAGFASTAWADVSVSADVSARVGTLDRSGAWKANYNNSNSSVDGNFDVFFAASKDLKNGYTTGFNCNTVATTVSGANAAFIGAALPVSHNWDPYFAGQDNYPNNGHGGGFSSYGDVNGDNKGPMCNDEVYGTLTTPFGRIEVGDIMNPMRLLYDETTVDPFWGDQRSYYNVADIRGNALRYANSFDQFNLDVQLQTATDASQPGNNKSKGRAITTVLTYDFGNGTLLGGGFLRSQGDFSGKYVTASATGDTHTAYGLTAKTLLGKVSLAWTWMTGGNAPDGFSQYGSKYLMQETDNTFKVSYDLGRWTLQGFLSKEMLHFNTPAAWGAAYTVQEGAMAGKSFNRLDIDRTNWDFWGLYNLGDGSTPYIRLNTISKKYTAPDLSGFQSTIRATKIEGGWMFHF